MVRTLLTLVLLSTLAAAQEQKETTCSKCGKEKYGTAVQWQGSPSEAAAKAKKEEKLVFVLHVSGYFEDPKFT